MDREKHTDEKPQGSGKDNSAASASGREPMQGMEMHGHAMSGQGMQGGMAHADHMGHMGNLKVKFWVCLIVSFPIL